MIYRRIIILALSILAALSALSAVSASAAEAAPLRVRVRGAAKLTVRASRDQTAGGANELLLAGTLADDAGDPLGLQTVNVEVTREADPHDERVTDALRGAGGCDRSAASPPSPPAVQPGRHGPTAWGVRAGGANEVVVVTDEEGRFCFRARLDPDHYKARLVYRPTSTQALVDGTEREITFDLSRRGLALRFDPTPRIVQLDTPRASIEAVAIIDDDATPRVAPGLALVLANEKEELARGLTDTSGRARFSLPGSRLGPPGRGELHVSFAGDGETARATYSEEIERHVKVALKVPAAERGELVAAVPEDGVPIVVEAGSSLGPIAEGTIEARIGSVVVGAAPVEQGSARLTLTFSSQGSEALVGLRYVPASPWYEPIGEPTVRVPIRGPSLLSKIPILLAGLGVLAFFLVGRVSGQKNKPEPAPSKDAGNETSDGKPRIDVVRRAARGHEGWSGRVVDAHEGTPVRSARVWIERGTFEGRAVLASVETDAYGRFTLPGIGPTAGDERIVAEARHHSRLTQDLPPPGEIAIALAARRRAILAKLVTWARRRGAPFDARPEPTPGHVRRAAADDASTRQWADAVERAVFGPGEVDARAEQEVERLAPNDRNGQEPARPDLGPKRDEASRDAEKEPSPRN
ncbi:MAG TPA: hypothetical protein VM925_01530 [Labilithrix sp.]|nr:hypothetical protein [Labilithrix sp.]